MSTKESIVVICPGRGTYTKAEAGYLNKYRPGITPYIDAIDEQLKQHAQPSVSELDNEIPFSFRTHTPGEFASTLIYACSLADFLNIDRDRYEISAITGNSMGWYTALALAGGLKAGGDFHLIHSMGSMMRDKVIGGQLIYPVTDDNWQHSDEREQHLNQEIELLRSNGAEIHDSIYFGGYRIIGGESADLKKLAKNLIPIDDRYPFMLINHAAFHTPMMHEVSQRGLSEIPIELFQSPTIPLIDGTGKIWQPLCSSPEQLRHYTLTTQVYATYDFTCAVTTAIKEFAPDKLVLLGPGATTGGAIGQCLVKNRWQGISNKKDFTQRQTDAPFLIAMGREDQRKIVGKI